MCAMHTLRALLGGLRRTGYAHEGRSGAWRDSTVDSQSKFGRFRSTAAVGAVATPALVMTLSGSAGRFVSVAARAVINSTYAMSDWL